MWCEEWAWKLIILYLIINNNNNKDQCVATRSIRGCRECKALSFSELVSRSVVVSAAICECGRRLRRAKPRRAVRPAVPLWGRSGLPAARPPPVSLNTPPATTLHHPHTTTTHHTTPHHTTPIHHAHTTLHHTTPYHTIPCPTTGSQDALQTTCKHCACE